MQPRMVIVAGPPGSGKSTAFPVKSFGLDYFNADDRAAELNGGSYQGITLAVRKRVGKEFEDFVIEQIKRQKSFAIETTLRSDVTFNQAKLAREAGFQIEMLYVCGGSFDNCLKRVIARGFAGGHSAPVNQLRLIYESSLKNLPLAISEMDGLRVYDNSRPGQSPKLVLEVVNVQTKFIAETKPNWLASSLKLP
ncbi:MAG: hypothetical protein K2Y22_17855 [Candidatus Obscuribacterales bacterium]|nr:hypothetical protein [Candidatus Obscuribacterales bacterium]